MLMVALSYPATASGVVRGEEKKIRGRGEGKMNEDLVYPFNLGER